MTQQQTVNTLLCLQTTIGLLIATRAFYLYKKNRNDELAILAIAMITIAAASISGLIADNVFASADRFGGKFNVLWFQYGGQTISYLFIFLSTLQNSDDYIASLKRWHLVITAILVVVALATPIIPPFPSPNEQAILSNTRSFVCFITFARYSYFFFNKESRFSFLMALAFLLLTFGIIIVTAQFYPHGPIIDVYLGYALRITGLIVLFIAFWLA